MKALQFTRLNIPEDRDKDFIDKVMGATWAPLVLPTGSTNGYWDFWDIFAGQYLNDAADPYSGLNTSGSPVTDVYKVKAQETDTAGYLLDKLKVDAESGIVISTTGTSNILTKLSLDIQESDSTGISLLKDSKTVKKLVAGVGMTINTTDDEITFNSTGELGDITTQDVTSQASESWNGEDEPLDIWQANAKVLIDGNSAAVDALATASMEYIYNGDLPLTTVEQKIPFVTLIPSSNTDVMDIDDTNNQAELYVDARYTYYTYISVTNDTQLDHIMHLITRTEGGTLLTDREFTVDRDGYLLLRLEDTVADITGTPLVFELYATADDSNALKITYLKSHISAGGEALVTSYLKRDGSNAEEDFDIGDSNFHIDGAINPNGETTEFGGDISLINSTKRIRFQNSTEECGIFGNNVGGLGDSILSFYSLLLGVNIFGMNMSTGNVTIPNGGLVSTGGISTYGSVFEGVNSTVTLNTSSAIIDINKKHNIIDSGSTQITANPSLYKGREIKMHMRYQGAHYLTNNSGSSAVWVRTGFNTSFVANGGQVYGSSDFTLFSDGSTWFINTQ